MDVAILGHRQHLRSQLFLYFSDVRGLFELVIYLISASGFTISVDMLIEVFFGYVFSFFFIVLF